jgi:hypothetical protein
MPLRNSFCAFRWGNGVTLVPFVVRCIRLGHCLIFPTDSEFTGMGVTDCVTVPELRLPRYLCVRVNYGALKKCYVALNRKNYIDKTGASIHWWQG